LQPQDRRSSRAGDREEAVIARSRWLARGFVSGLAAQLGRQIDGLNLPKGCSVVDVGCGEGTLTAQLFAARAVDVVGIDLSVRAIRLAARAAPQWTWIVANADRSLPLSTGTVLLAVSIFGRRPVAELSRVLAPEGTLLVVVPGEDDLIELREAAQGGARRLDRLPDLLAEIAPAFSLASRSDWRHRTRHDREALDEALSMSYRGARARERDRLGELAEMDVTLSAAILALVPRGGLR